MMPSVRIGWERPAWSARAGKTAARPFRASASAVRAAAPVVRRAAPTVRMLQRLSELQAPVQAVRVERRPLCIGAECVPAANCDRKTSCRKRAHRREMRPFAAGHLREAILWQCLCSDSCIGCSGPHLVSVCTFSPAAGAAKKDCATACLGFCIGCSGCFSSCSAYCTDCSDAAAAAGHLREAIPWQRFVRAAALAVRDR